MKYFNEDEQYIKGECLNCNRVLKIKRDSTQKTSEGFALTPPIRCHCGSVHAAIQGFTQEAKANTKHEVRCPKCLSTSLAVNKKGFGLGKAVAGGLLLGPIGLLGGFWNSGKVKVTCLKCCHSWNVG